MKGFGSDNHSGVHPEIMKSIIEANVDHAPSYGTDFWSEQLIEKIKNDFGSRTEIFLVFNGTAANVLSLRACVQSFQAVICSDVSHLNVDECGAPEFFTGAKLIPIPSRHGKITVADMEKALIRRGDQHFSQAAAVSITQPTELGTCYSIEELKEISQWCKAKGLYLHIDGARLANAAYFLGTDLSTVCRGADIVSMGGTKNGLMMGEAILILNPELAENFKYLRKQSSQLPSKTRFVAASFLCYLSNDLWKRIAEHSCTMAQSLHKKLKEIPALEITAPCQSNAAFVKIPQKHIKELKKHFFFYVWNEETFECRLMTTWDTQIEEIENFSDLLKKTLGDHSETSSHSLS